jgi:hypothetical protein
MLIFELLSLLGFVAGIFLITASARPTAAMGEITATNGHMTNEVHLDVNPMRWTEIKRKICRRLLEAASRVAARCAMLPTAIWLVLCRLAVKQHRVWIHRFNMASECSFWRCCPRVAKLLRTLSAHTLRLEALSMA